MAKSGGRPLPKVVEDNFDRLEDVPNSSNRSYSKSRNLKNMFAFEPPLTIQSNNSDDLLTGPGDISVDEIDAEFDALEKQNIVERFKDVDIDGLEILEGNVYNFDELA
ncbi:hypothetical protein BDR06DRAFT_975910 [Suillus hirtellus]|nr:hypothetical protein BDR06DRAFT_975910 [Suillus hirtellus]